MADTRSARVLVVLYAFCLSGALALCTPSCTILGLSRAQAVRFDWVTKTATATVTAATVVEIIDTDLDTTRTTTIFNDAVDLPTSTNSDGTVTQVVTYTREGKELTTEIAFPTSFYTIPQIWEWSGKMPTTDADGQPSCMTATSATISWDYYTQPSTITMPPLPSGIDEDPRGWHFKPNQMPQPIYDKVGPKNELAYQSCDRVVWAPLEPEYAAAYVVETSRSFESGLSTPFTSTSPRASKTTSDETMPTTQTVVSEGAAGPTTVTQTVAGLPSATANTATVCRGPGIVLLISTLIVLLAGL